MQIDSTCSEHHSTLVKRILRAKICINLFSTKTYAVGTQKNQLWIINEQLEKVSS